MIFERMIKVLLVVLLIFVIIVVKRAVFVRSVIPTERCAASEKINLTKDMLETFRESIKISTVSYAAGQYEVSKLEEMKMLIFKRFPLLYSSPFVTCEDVGIKGLSLLCTLEGSNSSLTPYLLMGHIDVVPADDLQGWLHSPFSAEIDNGFIYGRGTIDDKHTVLGILEAVEQLLRGGFHPARKFFLAFGHDEEVAGSDGARRISEILQRRNVTLEFLLDEGMTIINDLIPGISQPVALIGTSEKGSMMLQLEVTGDGGHSSMPPRASPVGILADAVSRLESKMQPSMFGYGPERALFEHLAPHMSFLSRMVMCNLWLFSNLVSWFMSLKPSTNASIRTTTAITRFNAGVKDNVLPQRATATVNHRVHPAQKLADVIKYDQYVINDPRVTLKVIKQVDPLPISPDHGIGYTAITNSIYQVWGDKHVLTAPSVMIGNTDTAHYLPLTQNMYRFSPTFMYPEDLKRFHGKNERISIQNYEAAINFYHHVILNADKIRLESQHQHQEL